MHNSKGGKIRAGGLVCFLLGATLTVLGFAIGREFFPTSVECVSEYTFINPYPDCESIDENVRLERFRDISADLDQYILSATSAGKATEISVFSRDLTSHRWIGKNEYENFSPGSLMKLPLLVGYLKLAELNPEMLATEITLSPDAELLSEKEELRSSEALVSGMGYTIEELLRRMIVYSDNDATHLLTEYFESTNPVFLEKVFADLGVRLPTSGGAEQEFVTSKVYASILRSLYNASYLTRASSNTALELMSKSEFKEGIVAGVPDRLVVAHKFGDRVVLDQSGKVLERSLHDCGIVYAPGGPFSLCIMTKGADFDDLKEVIRDVTKIVYERAR